MSTFKDHFSGHAADYRAFRPTYPPELFAFLAAVAPAHDLAWDCGTGSGQAAVPLAEYFPRVFATDASAEQVKNADPHPRVEYAVAPAEKCPLPDASADLVTVAQALHWFDFDKFYAEVRRVCRTGGFFAAWAYDFHDVNPDVDPVLARLQSEFVGPYWPPERVLVEAGYRTIPFPFEELPAPAFELTRAGSAAVDRLLEHVVGDEAVRGAHRFNPVERLAGAFAAAWGAPATVRTVRWKLALARRARRLSRLGGASGDEDPVPGRLRGRRHLHRPPGPRQEVEEVVGAEPEFEPAEPADGPERAPVAAAAPTGSGSAR